MRLFYHLTCFLLLWASFDQDPNFTATSKGSSWSSLFSFGSSDAGGASGGSGGGGSSGGGSGGGGSSSSANDPDTQATTPTDGNTTSSSTDSSTSSTTVDSLSSSTNGESTSSTTPASVATQQSTLTSAATSATPTSSTSSSDSVSALSSPTSTTSSTADTSSSSSASSSSTSSSTSGSSSDSSVQDIRTALFGSENQTAQQAFSSLTLYRYYQWVSARQEAHLLRKSFADPIGTKILGHSLDVMLGTLDPTQPLLGTYNVTFSDALNRALGVNSDPVILPWNLIISQLLRAILFPVIQPSSDLTTYVYSQPSQNLTNNMNTLSFHAQQVSQYLGSNLGALGSISQNYIYAVALNLQLTTCQSNYLPASTSGSTSTATSALQSMISPSTSPNSAFYLVPTGTDLTPYQLSGLTGMTAVTCSANLCAGGSGQGCPAQGLNYDPQGNGFPGILNGLSLLNQVYAVNTQSDAVAIENASMVLVNNQQYTGSDLADPLQCMSPASLFGAKASILCQKANVAMLDLLIAYNLEKSNQASLGGDLNAQGISSGTQDGLNFVTRMKSKVQELVSRLNDLMPVIAASTIYQASYQYFLTQVIPSHAISHLPASNLALFNQMFSSTPPASFSSQNAPWIQYQKQLNSPKMSPTPSGEQRQQPVRTQSPVAWTGSNFLFGENADSNDLLISMSSQTFLESLLNAVMSTPFIAGLPIPKNSVDTSGRMYQWVAVAGGFFLLSSEGATGDWFMSKTLTGSSANPYQVVASSIAAGEQLWSKRRTYLSGLGSAIAQQNQIVMHDASVQSWALTQIKNYEYDRSVQYTFKVTGTSDSAAPQNYTPIQILKEVATWRLNPAYGWRNSLDIMDTQELLRELLYISSEQQALMLRVLLNLEDMKLLQAVRFYNEGGSTANSMGMGPLANIQNNIQGYMTGSAPSNFGNVQQMQQDSQQSINDSLAAAQSSMTSSSVSSLISGNASGSSTAATASASFAG